MLHNCVKNVIIRAEQYCCKSITIPAISSGIFGYPKDFCAHDIFDELIKIAKAGRLDNINRIRLTNFDDETVGFFEREFTRLFAKPISKPQPQPQIAKNPSNGSNWNNNSRG